MGTVLDWCDSYLTDRTPSFQQGAQRSEPYWVYYSVPQGLVLGPEELIAFTEDLDDLIGRHHLSRHHYADDTQLIDGSGSGHFLGVILMISRDKLVC